MTRLRARRLGFTLVELLVVIAIITVLIAIALPVFSRARERARQTACMANLHQIAMAVRMYRMDMGQFPGPYDPVMGEGGLNTLYPAYLDSRSALICPDDQMDTGQEYVDQKVFIEEDPSNHHAVTYRTLLEAASSLYMDQDPDGEYFVKLWRGENFTNPEAPLDPSFFVEHYSSYNHQYNWIGYVQEDAEYSFCELGYQWFLRGDDVSFWRMREKALKVLDSNDKMASLDKLVNWYSGNNLSFWYMWYRWDPENALGVWTSPEAYDLVNSQLQYHLAQQTYWYDYNPWDLAVGERLQDGLRRPLWDPGNPDPTSYDYRPYGMPSPVFPGLINRNAPDTTVVTRCSHHRLYTIVNYGETESGKDIALRLDGSAIMIVGLKYDWAAQPRATQ